MQEFPIIKPIKDHWPNGWGKRTCLMGVLNVTPDSFSDGGNFFEPLHAVDQASQILGQGADVIDIGGQSTRPGADIIPVEIELSRVIPVIKSIRLNHPNALISLDTYYSKVAYEALNIGVNWINDVSGGRLDPNIFKVVAEAKCPYVLTHSRGNSHTMAKQANYKSVVEDVISELQLQTNLALASGISEVNLIWDPGIGFAKNKSHNLDIISSLETIKDYGYPVLLGPSRKKFIGEILSEPEPK